MSTHPWSRHSHLQVDVGLIQGPTLLRWCGSKKKQVRSPNKWGTLLRTSIWSGHDDKPRQVMRCSVPTGRTSQYSMAVTRSSPRPYQVHFSRRLPASPRLYVAAHWEYIHPLPPHPDCSPKFNPTGPLDVNNIIPSTYNAQ